MSDLDKKLKEIVNDSQYVVEGNYHKWVGPLPREVFEAARKAAGIES